MSFTWLVVSACMALSSGKGQVCKDFDLPLNGITKNQCELHGQMAIALWANEHEQWKVNAYKCIEEKEKEEKI